jgi:hypothetical protein
MSEGPDYPIPFNCVDCGCEVYRWPAGAFPAQPARCATCQWIADIPDDVDRKRLRAWLAEHDA